MRIESPIKLKNKKAYFHVWQNIKIKNVKHDP